MPRYLTFRPLVFLCLLGLVSCGLNPYEATLKVSRVSLELDSADAQGSFTVISAGETGSVLNWKATSLSPLVTFEPDEGSLPEGEEAAVNVKVDRSSLRRGQFINIAVNVESNGGTSKIEIRFVAVDDGMLACGTFPESFNQEAEQDTKQDTKQDAPAAQSSLPYALQELLVQYTSPGETQSLLGQASLERLSAAVTSEHGLQTLKEASSYRPALVSVPLNESVPEAMARLSADPRVAYAEPNYYVELLSQNAPNDPLVSEQWNLLEFGLPEAWAIDPGTNDVVIAVIDSGVDMLHEDLVDKVVPGCDFFAQDNNPSPVQIGANASHGTHVAGIAAATGGNGVGVAGVAYGPGVKILPINIFDEFGSSASLDDLFEAMAWAAGERVAGIGTNTYPADIINMSLGVDPENLLPDTLQSVTDVTKRLYERGVILVAASGNKGLSERVFAPASSPWVFAVGAVTSEFARSSFSNYAQTGRTVDFMAPGGEGNDCGTIGIRSTFPDDTYACLAGTSMASPFLAGVAALVLSQNSDLTPGQVKARLSQSALFDSDYMTKAAYGAGIVCADKALGAPTRCGR